MTAPTPFFAPTPFVSLSAATATGPGSVLDLSTLPVRFARSDTIWLELTLATGGGGAQVRLEHSLDNVNWIAGGTASNPEGSFAGAVVGVYQYFRANLVYLSGSSPTASAVLWLETPMAVGG